MNVNANRALYYPLRAALALLGLFLISSALLSFLYPDIVHSESRRPVWQNTLLNAAFLLYGLLLLVPYRRLTQSFMFPVALFVFALGVLWAAYACVSGLAGLVQGRKGWLILPLSGLFVALAVGAPVALMMRRRLDAL